MEPSHEYLRTDEIRELLEALRKVSSELDVARTDNYAWKWAIIAMQNAVQNAIVVAISGTDQLGALTKKAAERWLVAYAEDRTDVSDPRLAEFLELYDRMKLRTAFPETADVDDDIKRLVRLRNDFMHFTPKGWSIQLAGLPRIMRSTLSVIDHLDVRGHIPWFEKGDREAARAACSDIRTALDAFERIYLLQS